MERLDEFQVLAHRTSSLAVAENIDPTYARVVDCQDKLRAILREQIRLGMMADNLKRHIFYGKPLQSWADIHIKADEFIQGLQPITILPQQIELEKEAFLLILHGNIGMITEAAEMSETLLKYMHNQPLDAQNIVEEIGDSAWYLGEAALGVKRALSTICTAVIAKLRVRHPGKYSEENATNRNIAAEQQAIAAELKEPASATVQSQSS